MHTTPKATRPLIALLAALALAALLATPALAQSSPPPDDEESGDEQADRREAQQQNAEQEAQDEAADNAARDEKLQERIRAKAQTPSGTRPNLANQKTDTEVAQEIRDAQARTPFAEQELAARDAAQAAQGPTQEEIDALLDPEVRELIKRVEDALGTLESLECATELTFEGGASLKDYLPSGTATLKAARDPSTGAWGLRVTGRVKDDNLKEAYDADAFFTTQRVVFTDRRSTALQAATGARRDSAAGTIGNLLWFEILRDPILRDERRVSLTRDPQQVEIDGVKCDVLFAQYPPKNANAPRSARADQVESNFVWTRFAIGPDGLPRRISRHAQPPGAGMEQFSFTLHTTFTKMNTKAGLLLSDIRLELPAPTPVEGIPAAAVALVDDADPASDPATTPTTPAATDPDAARFVTRQLPQFELKLADGSALNPDTAAGSVHVLYFSGSWSLKSRDLDAALVTAFRGLASADQPNTQEDAPAGSTDDPVAIEGARVVLAAVRDRNAAGAAEALNDAGLVHTLAPIADDAANAFRLKLFPAVIVIDRNARWYEPVIFNRDATAQSVAERVAELIAHARRP